MDKIKGGFYIKARCIQDAAIATQPPHVREIWDWLIKESNHGDSAQFERGQCMRSYRDIQDGLAWYIGWRKMTYTKWQCENAMKWLTKENMITTRKTTRGLIISLVNYDKYQTVSHYESHKRATREPQTPDTINKNEKNGRMEEEREGSKPAHVFVKPTLQELQAHLKATGSRINPDRFLAYYESKGWKVGNSPMKDWKAAVRTWNLREQEKGAAIKTPEQLEAENNKKMGVNQ